MSHSPDNPVIIKGAEGGVQVRRNILDFSTDPALSKQWNLYLKALSNFQAKDINDPLSFYQVAGIHGLPYVHWLENAEKGDRPGEYCTHGTSLFLTWHRPYLLLFEQCIVNTALEVAESLPAEFRDEYKEEAVKIRLPYWDWATNSDIPQPLRNDSALLKLPPNLDGVAIRNPLYSFKLNHFQRQRDFNILYADTLAKFEETKRCPDNYGASHPERVDEQLAGPRKLNPDGTSRPPFRDAMYKLLTLVDDYGSFSNTSAPKNVTPSLPHPAWQSLESYHNEIHNYIGSYFGPDPNTPNSNMILGHMTEVPVSGFDPIFWLHHANIDRMYALWQCIHFDSAFKGQPPEINRFPEPGKVESNEATVLLDDSIETTLRPFHIEKERLWQSRDMHTSGLGDAPPAPYQQFPSVFDFQYRYPEIGFKATNQSERERLKAEVLLQVRELYGPPDDDLSVSTEPLRTFGRHVIPHIGYSGQRYRREWMIFLRVRKYLVPENFAIFFFLGEPDPDPRTWVTSPHLAGSFQTFKSKTDYCANCFNQSASQSLMSGGIHLSNALYDKLQEETPVIALDDDDKVTAWIAKNLKWRILKIGGTELKLDQVSAGEEGQTQLEVKFGSFDMTYLGETTVLDGTTPTNLDSMNNAFDTICKVYNAKTYWTGTKPADIPV